MNDIMLLIEASDQETFLFVSLCGQTINLIKLEDLSVLNDLFLN